MIHKSSFIKNNYLSDCDLIYKYRLKNIYNKPSIKQINIEFPIQNRSTSVENISLVNSQAMSFVLMYCLFSLLPYISNTKIKNSIRGEKSLDVFSLSVSIFKKDLKYSFLRMLLVETWSNVAKEGLNPFNKNIKLKNKSIGEEKSSFTISLPLFLLSEMDPIFLNYNSKESLVQITFLLNHRTPLSELHFLSLVENLPLFWISGSRLK